MKAFILAGGKDNLDFGGYNKALLPIGEKPMIEYVIEALKKSGFIDSIAVIGNPKLIKEKTSLDKDRDIIMEEDEKMVDNVLKGLNHFIDQDRILIITSDIPFISPEAIDHFIQSSLNSKAEFCYPIIKEETMMESYPDIKRTYLKLKEGRFTGGNMALINPTIGNRLYKMANYMIENRKKPWKMVKVLGLSFLLQLLLRTLTIKKLEDRVANIANITSKAIISPYPDIGNDIDKPEDIKLAEKYLKIQSK